MQHSDNKDIADAKSVYLIAGEPSGDLLGSRLMKAIRKQQPDVTFAGVGGEAMQESGLKSLFNIAEISVMGFFEVLPKLRLILRRIRQTVDDIKCVQPDVIVTIDSWGFVTSVLKKLKKDGVTIPKVHYVAPQVWAWKKGRAKQVPKIVDRLMTLLPHEPQLFEKYGLKCDFVGHPVIENTANVVDDSEAFRRRHSIDPDCELLCVLPGSRHSEVRWIAPLFLEAVKAIVQKYPGTHLVIPTVEAMANEVNELFAPLQIPYTLVHGQQERYSAFKACKMAIATSGTVSLELTACGTPHTIAYRFSPFTQFFAELLIKIPYVDLINILANKEIITEFTRKKCTSQNIAATALRLFESPSLLQQQVKEAQVQLAKLKPANLMPSEAAARVVMEEGRF